MARTMTDEEFTEFVHAAWPRLYRTAYLMLGDHQLAEDLTQTALAKTYASWRRVQDPAAAPAYARVVLANTAASWFRRRSWRNEHPTEVLPDAGVDHDPSTRTAVVDALATLAPRQRAVVVLRYYDDLSVREVAHALGISEGTVKSQTSDALARLRSLLDDEVVPPAPADDVLADGRAIRRRRRTTTAVVGAVVALVALASGTALLGRDRTDRTPEPARPTDQQAYEQRGAWAQGDELHVGNHTAVVPGLAQLRYTSAGVVARATDGYVLATPAGDVEPLDLDLVTGGLGIPDVATDPGTPNLGYVRNTGDGRGQAVVRDLATGSETEVGTPFRIGDSDLGRAHWLSGDLFAYAGGNGGVVVDWRTGEPARRPPGWWQAAGVSVDFDPTTAGWTLTTFAGDPLLTLAGDRASSYGALSPDGRYFLAATTVPGMTVYDVRSGEETGFESRAALGYGWTPDGHLIGRAPGRDEIEICDPVTAGCEDIGASSTSRLTLVAGTPGRPL